MDLLKHLALGDTVITPNNRLSAIILEDYYQAHGAKPLKKPSCIPYRSFLTNSYKFFIQNNDDRDHPLLFNDQQCQYLWRELLQQHPEITYSEGLLAAVMEAWNNCLLWQIPPEHSAFVYTPQTQQFQRWWLLFNEKIKQLEAITEHQIVDYLVDYRFPFLKNKVIWACFDSFTPQQQALQEYLAQRDIQQLFYDLAEKNSECQQFAAEHSEEEREQLTAFLKQRLALGEQRIAVVVPDLQQQAMSLQRHLLRHLDATLFNISLGKTLKDYPLVAHALQWLTLGDQQISNHQARLLLHSPYLKGSQSELNARSQFMQDNPLLQKPMIDFDSWTNALAKNCPILAKTLTAMPKMPRSATPRAWIDLFKARLEALGFPGDYGLESENYQCFHAFMEVFNILGQLSIFDASMTYHQALSALKNISAKTIFQAQTNSKEPIQVLGLLEASGCQFDSLWVMGLTDQCLPEKTRLSPFIPHELQRSKNMPHSMPEKELQLAKQLLQRLKRGCHLGIFSYPILSADSPNLPSPLIESMENYSPIAQQSNGHSCQLISYEENYLYPIQAEEKIRGGTALLANQAKCPFKAFAAHRLHAKPLAATHDGLDAKDRGQLIHTIMENLWRNLGSQEQLLALSETELDKRIEEAILLALSPFTLIQFIQDIELKRLKRLVNACLQWEKQRPAFRIEALEEAYTLQLNSLDIQVRVDRLDKTSDGAKWVIDYKSSLPSTKPWQEERPQEPQLLLYALLDEAINTLLFLELKAGKLAVCGFSEEQQELAGISNPKKDSSWTEQRGIWKEQLNLLADEFSQGFCPPKPLGAEICGRCDFQNLCRFAEGNL